MQRPRTRKAWGHVEAAKVESLWLLRGQWASTADVMRKVRPAEAARARRAHLLKAAELVHAMASTAAVVRRELKAASYGGPDGLVEWALQAETVAMQVQDMSELAPDGAAFDAASKRHSGVAPAAPVGRPEVLRAVVVELQHGGRQLPAAPAAALAYLEIGVGLEPPCSSKEEWDARRQMWRQALRRATGGRTTR